MTKEELMSAITGLPAETQIYKINDYADLDHSDGCPLLGVIVVNEPDSEPIIYMTKKERERQIKKAYIFYRRRVRTLLATGRYLLTIDYRKKDINNEK